MAKDPKARHMTLSYDGGTFRAAIGLMEYLFGVTGLGWVAGSGGTTAGGRRKWKYKGRQKSNAAAGKEVFLLLDNDEVYSGRVTGAYMDFIEQIVTRCPDKVLNVWTMRGTEAGKQPLGLVPNATAPIPATAGGN